MDKLSLQLNHIEEYMGHVEKSVEMIRVIKFLNKTKYEKTGDNNTGGHGHLRTSSW